MEQCKVMKKSTVIDRLVEYAVRNEIIDTKEVIRNGWTGYAQLDNQTLIEEYNQDIDNEELMAIVNDEDITQSSIGPDDVVTRKPLTDNGMGTIPAGTKCTIMDIEPMDEDGSEPITIQVDATGVEIRCDRSMVVEISDVE